ncbi:SDR family oxidoreductase [uncultured Sunxiuqinia sp.]|uniref:SDR family oxidoreductase n=1 Tax=uncultured Sunxiuqinia sp. TaxID=1573825 RepID=UPI0030D999DF
MKKNILVTGGAQGIGKITVRELLDVGYMITVFDRDTEALKELTAAFQTENLLAIPVDVSDEEMVKAGIQRSADHFGRIDGLVNNAVYQVFKPFHQLSLQDWNRALAVNLTGPFLCVKYAQEELRKSRGAIVNICSTRALQSEAGTESYSASKGGLLALTHALAMSLGPDVRVNAISPGWIDVSGEKKKSAARQYDLRDEDHAQHPAGRVGKAEDIAHMVLFLLDPANGFITGQNFVIDGGMTKKMIYK